MSPVKSVGAIFNQYIQTAYILDGLVEFKFISDYIGLTV
jgi:hypothetical protein